MEAIVIGRDVFCPTCGRKLAEVNPGGGGVEIKCSRCKEIAEVKEQCQKSK